MRPPAPTLLFWGAYLLQHLSASPVGGDAAGGHASRLQGLADIDPQPQAARQLHGRFLHITDLHPDPFYKLHSSTKQACHRGKGAAGTYGAEISDCDTPFSLVNATLQWIEDNIRDDIDFVVWTGDSARHDSDEKIPRNAHEVLNTNRWIAQRFKEVFRKHGGASIPIVPTLGNNDILPHNILAPGPNKWLKSYSDIWNKFIPEEQRHVFEHGGWFYVEAIPNKLAVFSLNTLYFFDRNAAVDGCASPSEPGYEQMEWLRIQLQFIRERGMKAILTGHVPPARTESKQLWDETCWQKYTLWLRQYRDVVVASLYGHMNIDHFMLQDTKEIDLLAAGQPSTDQAARATLDKELTIESANSYLKELRADWSDLPNPPLDEKDEGTSKKKKGKKSKKDKALKKIGGRWGERYHVTHVSPSLVPNFFPTIRVIEYNITGIDEKATWLDVHPEQEFTDPFDEEVEPYVTGHYDPDHTEQITGESMESAGKKKKKKKKGKKGRKHKPSSPDLTIPPPPSKNSPAGPAYSPQTLTLLGYTQYFANITHINNDRSKSETLEDSADTSGWLKRDHHGKPQADSVTKPKAFHFQVEYDTFTDPIYKLKDMTVRSYIDLAHKIGQYKAVKADQMNEPGYEDHGNDSGVNGDTLEDDDVATDKEKKKHKKHRKQREKNKVWFQFIKRAFVGTLDEREVEKFEAASEILELPSGEGLQQIPMNEEL